jgi:amino acid adenylation domain-containing protein
MNLLALIKEVKSKGIKLFVENQQLKLIDNHNELDQALLEKIKANKAEIINLLSLESTINRSIIKVERNDSNTYPVLSSAQQSLWFLSELGDEGSEAYNESSMLLLKGELSIDALKISFAELVKRHSILRTVFHKDKFGAPLQVILDRTDLEINYVKVKNSDEAKSIFNKFSCTPFKLQQFPLIRVCLMELSPSEYILAVVMHHIITDGTSFNILFNDLFEYYKCHIEGRKPQLEPLPIQFIDYAHWEKNILSTEPYQQKLTYWKNKLIDCEQLQLPTDKSRPPLFSFKGNKINFNIEERVAEKLKETAKKQGVTLYSLLLSAFTLLLSRYANQKDILVCTPVSNRGQSEVQNIIGFFVNTLVLRAKISSAETFSELLKQVSSEVMNSLQNQELPFSEVVKALGIEHDFSKNPISQVLFSFAKSTEAINQKIPGLEIARYSFGLQETAKFDLALNIIEFEKSISAAFLYCTDLFAVNSIKEMAQNFLALLNSIISNRDNKISNIKSLSDDSYKKIIFDWNRTNRDYPQHKTICELFEEQVLRTPDNIAVIYEDEILTYRQLDEKANQFARLMQNRYNIRPNEYVTLCLDRSEWMLIAMLGTIKLGAAYVPIDPFFPPDRINFIITDTKAKLIITSDVYEKRLASICNTVDDKLVSTLSIDAPKFKSLCDTQEKTELPKVITSRDLAYVMYTSGTTGNPKGVMSEHRGIVNLIYWMQEKYPLKEGDRLLQKTTYVFDDSVYELFWPVLVGACLVFAKPEGHKDPDYLIKVINKQAINIISFVPSMLSVFIDSLEFMSRSSNHTQNHLTSLKYILCSGEPLPLGLVKKIHSLLPNTVVHNLYGPTEASIDVLYYDCTDPNLETIYIGKPIYNTTAYVLDEDLQLLPIGAVGELHIGGDALARGYLNREELTAEKFIKNPFQSEDDKALDKNDRLYKTGDLVRWHESGNIEYIGRNDFQVKIRGNRIELSEIEARLNRYPEVKQSVVLAKESRVANNTSPENKYLVAYYVANTKLNEADILNELAQNLPDYMLPTLLIHLDVIPLTVNGKLDRNKLPSPVLNEINDYEPPKSETEHLLVEIWANILNFSQNSISIADDFFKLGGNSLLMIMLLTQINYRLQLSLQIKDLFHTQYNRDIKSMAKIIDTLSPDNDEYEELLNA